jgi:hypothetical protein
MLVRSSRLFFVEIYSSRLYNPQPLCRRKRHRRLTDPKTRWPKEYVRDTVRGKRAHRLERQSRVLFFTIRSFTRRQFFLEVKPFGIREVFSTSHSLSFPSLHLSLFTSLSIALHRSLSSLSLLLSPSLFALSPSLSPSLCLFHLWLRTFYEVFRISLQNFSLIQ